MLKIEGFEERSRGDEVRAAASALAIGLGESSPRAVEQLARIVAAMGEPFFGGVLFAVNAQLEAGAGPHFFSAAGQPRTKGGVFFAACKDLARSLFVRRSGGKPTRDYYRVFFFDAPKPRAPRAPRPTSPRRHVAIPMTARGNGHRARPKLARPKLNRLDAYAARAAAVTVEAVVRRPIRN